jgi:hypothetical protein
LRPYLKAEKGQLWRNENEQAQEAAETEELLRTTAAGPDEMQGRERRHLPSAVLPEGSREQGVLPLGSERQRPARKDRSMKHMAYGALTGLALTVAFLLIIPPWLFRFLDWYFAWVKAFD